MNLLVNIISSRKLNVFPSPTAICSSRLLLFLGSKTTRPFCEPHHQSRRSLEAVQDPWISTGGMVSLPQCPPPYSGHFPLIVHRILRVHDRNASALNRAKLRGLSGRRILPFRGRRRHPRRLAAGSRDAAAARPRQPDGVTGVVRGEGRERGA